MHAKLRHLVLLASFALIIGMIYEWQSRISAGLSIAHFFAAVFAVAAGFFAIPALLILIFRKASAGYVAAALLAVLSIFGLWRDQHSKSSSLSSEGKSIASVADGKLSSAWQLPDVKPADALIKTLASSQDAEGLTEATMNIEALRNLEIYVSRRLVEKTGIESHKIESTYLDVSGKRLGVVRVKLTAARMIFVFGFFKDEFRKVLCVRESEDDIPLLTGACGDKLNETFGLALPFDQ